jgi:hypothetical protein
MQKIFYEDLGQVNIENIIEVYFLDTFPCSKQKIRTGVVISTKYTQYFRQREII